MKKLYIFGLAALLFCFSSCKKESPVAVNDSISDTFKGEISDSIKAGISIDLTPIQIDIPKFDDASANAFVAEAKNYFQKVAEASLKGDDEQVLSLQNQAVEIDNNYQNAKKQLDTDQQKRLEVWYMKLVEAGAK